MELEKQVCGRKLAEQLRRLGLRQESHFWWHDCEHPVDGHKDYYISDGAEYDTDPAFESIYSAYTVAELGEITASARVTSDVVVLEFGCYHMGTMKNYWARKCYDSHKRFICDGQNEANMRAEMLVYLIENRVIAGVSGGRQDVHAHAH